MASDLVAVENRLWATADQLWANTGLKPSEFSTPVLGLIFLRYADKRFTDTDAALAARGVPADEREAMDYQAEGVLYLPAQARFSHLLTLTEGANLGKAIATAMSLVEEHNPELKGVLPRGYRIGPASKPTPLVNLSEIDFEALQAKFAQGHKRTEAEKLKQLIAGKLAQMVAVNASRVDLAAKFQRLIDDYNAGSSSIELFFADLKDFVGTLTGEEQRAIAEGLTEEELALFDILTKPEPVLTKAEQAEVKKACRELLDTLKREKLVFDWRAKQQTKAAVMQTLKIAIRPPTLPAAYTKEVRAEKMARAYAHLYDHYYGAGRSTYGP